MTTGPVDTTTCEGARAYLTRKRQTQGVEDVRTLSFREKEAAVTILQHWVQQRGDRVFRFGDALVELDGDAPLTKAALQILHGRGIVHLYNRVYSTRPTRGAFRW